MVWKIAITEQQLQRVLNRVNEQQVVPRIPGKDYSELDNATIDGKPMFQSYINPTPKERLSPDYKPKVKEWNWEEGLELAREKVFFSSVGSGIDAFLSVVPGTAPVMLTVYGSVLAYDCYKAGTGSPNWFNIFYSSLLIASQGALAVQLQAVAKFRNAAFTSMQSVIKWFMGTKLWKVIEPFVKMLASIASTILGWVNSGIEWIIKNSKNGNTLRKYAKTISGFLKSTIKTISDYLDDGIERGIDKVVSKVGLTSELPKTAVKRGVKEFGKDVVVPKTEYKSDVLAYPTNKLTGKVVKAGEEQLGKEISDAAIEAEARALARATKK